MHDYSRYSICYTIPIYSNKSQNGKEYRRHRNTSLFYRFGIISSQRFCNILMHNVKTYNVMVRKRTFCVPNVSVTHKFTLNEVIAPTRKESTFSKQKYHIILVIDISPHVVRLCCKYNMGNITKHITLLLEIRN